MNFTKKGSALEKERRENAKIIILRKKKVVQIPKLQEKKILNFPNSWIHTCEIVYASNSLAHTLVYILFSAFIDSSVVLTDCYPQNPPHTS